MTPVRRKVRRGTVTVVLNDNSAFWQDSTVWVDLIRLDATRSWSADGLPVTPAKAFVVVREGLRRRGWTVIVSTGSAPELQGSQAALW